MKAYKMQKDINEINMIVRWGILIGLAFFSIIAYFIWFVDFDIIRNPAIVKDKHLRLLLLIFAVYLSINLINHFIKYLARHLNRIYQRRFTLIRGVKTYEEAMEQIFFNEKKYDHVVLFLHGFTASSQEFQFIIPYLKANNINYYIPNIMGFGTDKTNILSITRRNDWYRSCLSMYDALSKIANKVSIVGHSMGSMLATYIAEHRQVHNLILTGPCFYSVKSDIKYKILLKQPLISNIYIWIIPYLPKPIRKGRKTTSDTLDDSHVNNIFQYLAVPTSSVREIFLMQDEVHLERAKYTSLSIIYGKHELTVNVNRLFSHLKYHHIQYDAYCMENSAHNVLEDFDRDHCSQLIVDILLDKKN